MTKQVSQQKPPLTHEISREIIQPTPSIFILYVYNTSCARPSINARKGVGGLIATLRPRREIIISRGIARPAASLAFFPRVARRRAEFLRMRSEGVVSD